MRSEFAANLSLQQQPAPQAWQRPAPKRAVRKGWLARLLGI